MDTKIQSCNVQKIYSTYTVNVNKCHVTIKRRL